MKSEQPNRSILKKIQDRYLIERIDHSNARRFFEINHASYANIVHKENEKPIFFFNASTRMNRLSLNAAFAWLTAADLQNSGVPIRFLYCKAGLKPCLLAAKMGTSLCRECVAFSNQMLDGMDNIGLEFIDNQELSNQVEGLQGDQLNSFTYQNVPLGELTLPSLRWILRRHHLEKVPEADPLHRQFIRSAWSTLLQAKAAIDEQEPRAIVLFNGLQYPEAIVKWYGRKQEIPVYTHEIGLMPYTAFFTEGEATACPIELPENFTMTSERNERLDTYLSGRMRGNFTTAGIQFWPEMKSLSPDFWKLARTFRQIVPVFTNVVFDTSQYHANVVFSNMFEWLDEVKMIIQNHGDTLFIIRAHPDEIRPGKESLETVADWVSENQLTHLPNCLFVGPDQYFSSYELIQNSKFVMVYNSTIGLEAAVMGAAVLCGGKSRYTQIPVCWFPPTKEKFREQAELFLNSETINIPPEYQKTARKFMYYQFFHTALSFSEFIEPDPVWKGYVKLKKFSNDQLSGGKNINLKVIENGILNRQPFVLPDLEEDTKISEEKKE